MKPERAQAGLKKRRRGSGRRRLADGVTKVVRSGQNGVGSAETRPDPGSGAKDGHLYSIRGAKSPRHAAGQAAAQAAMRRLMEETFVRCQPQVAAALQRCFTNPKTVLDCVRLLARLNGELP
jgi:hypothetical protein